MYIPFQTPIKNFYCKKSWAQYFLKLLCNASQMLWRPLSAPPKNVRKSDVSWSFQEVEKETRGIKWETRTSNIINLLLSIFTHYFNPACIYLFKFSNGNTRTMCEALTILTPEGGHSYHSGVFMAKFEQTSYVALVFPVMTSNTWMSVGLKLYYWFC